MPKQAPDSSTPENAKDLDATLEFSLTTAGDSVITQRAQLPQAPGVYRFYDTENRLLYVGKAKLLRKRVESYFRPNLLSPRTRLMVSQIARLAITVTRSEAEALLLETNLIKAAAPRYNILFRDDKSYPYIALKGGNFPRLYFYRGTTLAAKGYYGPFPNVLAVRESIRFLQKVFQLRTCEDSVFAHRSRPCLLHQIGRCSAPCVNLISPSDYQKTVDLASLFLMGKNNEVLDGMVQEMHAAAEKQNYEHAARYRDQIKMLRQVMQRQFAVSKTEGNVDIIAVVERQHTWGVNLSMVRNGKLLGDHAVQPTQARQASAQDVISAFLEYHYSQHPLPSKIILEVWPNAHTHKWLANQTTVAHPHFELEKGWMRMAKMNASLALLSAQNKEKVAEERLVVLQELLGLDTSNPWMECFDISHLSGEYTIASCVVWAHGKMDKRHYRRFRIRQQTGGDDVAAMTEALERRFSKEALDEKVLPDVLFVDGGITQVKAAARVLQEQGLSDLQLVGIAKGEGRKPGLETLISGSGAVWNLPENHPALLLIQVMRDEAHRFALMGHRAGRAKARNRSILEDIPGIGQARRRKLLQSFGGLEALKEASLEDLCQITGVDRKLAQTIHQHLHPNEIPLE